MWPSRPPTPPQPTRRPTTTEPIRSCVGCRRARPAAELVRLRLTERGIVDDPSAGGRGAWLCLGPDGSGIDQRCLTSAVRSRAFDRAFRSKVEPEEVDALMRRMSPRDDGGRVRKRR